MKIELNPSCSEAVFRFHTVDPNQMQQILQAIADEISANTNFELHQKQKIPLFKEPEMYDTEFTGTPSYSAKDKDGKTLTEEDVYPNAMLKSCAGLGDNSAAITVHKDEGFFTLNIGNNDINQNTTSWVEKIKNMGIKVEEAEYDEELKKIARDCTCGITFGFQSE